ncbi:hypothetical protein DFA_10765 [Cavenderia fasciculata]|uniref:Monalysin Pore-forming domain-containing protein n=1 Tax=Cavenderia fasciculata TaxID=261658 RepID=F4QBC0_CACFS|nr:uncharacterized protein DFA_10765 [Cavenderia fasciculata]EGG14892.1 hypothetical protein DFA_10765 [Cavenderia fasciculata]|eukprot:XP_004351408.1 hypothetical protein DFA_10765 [Cavenderia fasciculata]
MGDFQYVKTQQEVKQYLQVQKNPLGVVKCDLGWKTVVYEEGSIKVNTFMFPVFVYSTKIDEITVGTSPVPDVNQLKGFNVECAPANQDCRSAASNTIESSDSQQPITNLFDYGSSIPNQTKTPYKVPTTLPSGTYGVYQTSMMYCYSLPKPDPKLVQGSQFGWRKNHLLIQAITSVHRKDTFFIPIDQAPKTYTTNELIDAYFNGTGPTEKNLVQHYHQQLAEADRQHACQ